MDGYDTSTYGDRFADVYDEWYGSITDTDACVAAVAELAGLARLWTTTDRDGRDPSVLELGVGTGRIAIPLAAKSLRVTGVDASPAMLTALAAKPGGDQVATVLGDMVDPPLGGPDSPEPAFDLVLIAYNTLFNLIGPGEQARCLANMAKRLTPGGWLVVEAFVPDPDLGPGEAVTTRQVTADRVVLSVSRNDPTTQDVLGQYIDITEAGIKLRPWQIRWATPDQIDEMADEAGLVLVERWATWDRAPFTPQAQTHVSVYRLTRT